MKRALASGENVIPSGGGDSGEIRIGSGFHLLFCIKDSS